MAAEAPCELTGSSELIIGPFAVSGQCSAAELLAYIYMWGDVRGSNPQPPSSQPGALASEGFEPSCRLPDHLLSRQRH
jgi:hypothetical protein